VLVNSTGIFRPSPFEEQTEEHFEEALGSILRPTYWVSQAVVPSMRERGGGRIVNQASAGAFPAETVYGITKLALVGVTTTLARELGSSNITVNCLAPGITSSEAGKLLTPAEGEFRQQIEAKAALRAVGSPEELCGALLLCCSPAGSWMTGQVLHVDGGWVLRP
jgi:NAD(P)-dependent dehydrogenase (short-subunit alcohol dehydrogenase family)